MASPNALHVLVVLVLFWPKVALSTSDESIPRGDGSEVKIRVEHDVLVLNNDNFDVIVNSKPVMLVNFYAPWCEHCKTLEPHFNRAAAMMKKKKKRIPFGKVDCTKEMKLASRFNVNSYPHLFVFQNGTPEDYNGSMSAEGIVEEMMLYVDPKWKKPPTKVVELTADDFSRVVNKEDIMLVEFYAPWCIHCKKVHPELDRASRMLAENDPPIKIGRVNAVREKELAEAFAVDAYPKLYILRKGRPFLYEGPRHDNGIVEYMKIQALPPMTEVNSVKELKKNLALLDTTVIGIFEKGDTTQFNAFSNFCNDQRGNFTLLYSSSQEVADHFKVPMNSVILHHSELLRSKYEGKFYKLVKSDYSMETIRSFVYQHLVPVVGLRTRQNLWKYIIYPIVIVYYDVNFDFDYRDDTEAIRKEIVPVAQKYLTEVVFCISQEADFQDELGLLRLSDSSADVNVGLYMSARERYAMPPTDSFTSENLQKFVESVMEGKMKPVRRSQIAPKSQTGPLTLVVGSTFDELITDAELDVVVVFTTVEECEECKKFNPEIKELARRYEADKHIRVAKIDAVHNEFPFVYEFKFKDLPTIFFVDRDDKTHPKKYVGQRNVDSIIYFIEGTRKNRKDEL